MNGGVLRGVDGYRGQPFVAWMHITAAHAQHAASQAMASAAAYETAFATTVPPPLIVANRVQLAALVATNILGKNTPAIIATEAHYGEMWAQDAAAMYGYAATSASAGKLAPMTIRRRPPTRRTRRQRPQSPTPAPPRPDCPGWCPRCPPQRSRCQLRSPARRRRLRP